MYFLCRRLIFIVFFPRLNISSLVIFSLLILLSEVEGFLNSLVSLILVLPSDQNQSLISAFCDKILQSQNQDKRNTIRLKVYVS